MGRLSSAPGSPRRRRTLFHLCLDPDVKDDDSIRHEKQQPSSALGSPRITHHSPKKVHFEEFPTIHTYCVESDYEGSNGSNSSSTVFLSCSSTAANIVGDSRTKSGKQYQLLSSASNTCPHLQVQDASGSVSNWACHFPAVNDTYGSSQVDCGSGNIHVQNAAASGQPGNPFSPLHLSDGQLAVLSRLDVSLQAALQCDAQKLLGSSTGQQQLGRGTHSEVIQATIPWPSAEAAVAAIKAAAEAAQVNSPALATAVSVGLPVVVKTVVHERFQGDGLFNIEGRKREERFSRMVSGSMYFPRLYRAMHMKRRSYFLFSSMTAQPVTLAQYVQSMHQQSSTGTPAAATARELCGSSRSPADRGQSLVQQLQQPVQSCAISSLEFSTCYQTTCSNPAWQESVLQVLDDIAQGLDHLHKLGLLHLDLKPGNIIIREGGHAYLIDLGVACEVGTSLEQHGRCGTEAFMDPEIRFDKDLQGSYQKHHDYYSLGAVALYIVTKGDYKLFLQVQTALDQALVCRPYGGAHCRNSTAKTAVKAVGHIAAARRLLAGQAGTSQGVIDLVLGLMAAPDERPSTYEQFRDLLEHASKCNQPEQYTNSHPNACPKGQISTFVQDDCASQIIAYLVAAVLIIVLILWLTA